MITPILCCLNETWVVHKPKIVKGFDVKVTRYDRYGGRLHSVDRFNPEGPY